jgi:TetR/AcrR family fatty acid metabolism transcriptional regulator
MSPKIVNKIQRRAEIVQKAMQVIARKGIYNFKMIDIAEAAGIGKGTIYEYFPSKEKLIIGCFDQFFSDYDAILSEKVSEVSNPVEIIKLIIYASFDFFKKYEVNADVLFHFWAACLSFKDGLPLMSGAMEKFESYIVLVESVIQNGIETGTFKDVNVRYTSSMLMGMLDGLLFQYALGMIDIGDRKLPETVYRNFINGILKQEN